MMQLLPNFYPLIESGENPLPELNESKQRPLTLTFKQTSKTCSVHQRLRVCNVPTTASVFFPRAYNLNNLEILFPFLKSELFSF